MERHDLDPIALVFGATFVVLGLAYAIARWTWIDADRGWVLGAFLVGARHRRFVVSATSAGAPPSGAAALDRHAGARWRYPIS